MVADKYGPQSLRTGEKQIGVGRGILQRIGTNGLKRLDVLVLEKILNACDSSLAVYFNARALAEEMAKIEGHCEIVRLVGMALKIPDKADTLRKYLEALLADALRNEKPRQ